MFIATNNIDSICVGEDIHCYENDLQDEIAEAIQEGYNMYIDDLDWHPFMEAVEESYGNMVNDIKEEIENELICLLYTSPSPRDRTRSRMPSSA